MKNYQIFYILNSLAISENKLASWLGCSIRTFHKKRAQINRLAETIELCKDVLKMPEDSICSLLLDSRIYIDGTLDEERTISILSYICAFPHDVGWAANVLIVAQEIQNI